MGEQQPYGMGRSNVLRRRQRDRWRPPRLQHRHRESRVRRHRDPTRDGRRGGNPRRQCQRCVRHRDHQLRQHRSEREPRQQLLERHRHAHTAGNEFSRSLRDRHAGRGDGPASDGRREAIGRRLALSIAFLLRLLDARHSRARRQRHRGPPRGPRRRQRFPRYRSRTSRGRPQSLRPRPHRSVRNERSQRSVPLLARRGQRGAYRNRAIDGLGQHVHRLPQRRNGRIQRRNADRFQQHGRGSHRHRRHQRQRHVRAHDHQYTRDLRASQRRTAPRFHEPRNVGFHLRARRPGWQRRIHDRAVFGLEHRQPDHRRRQRFERQRERDRLRGRRPIHVHSEHDHARRRSSHRRLTPSLLLREHQAHLDRRARPRRRRPTRRHRTRGLHADRELGHLPHRSAAFVSKCGVLQRRSTPDAQRG